MNSNTATLTPTQRFWRLLHPDRKEIRNVYIYSIFNGLVNLSLPLGIQAIVNLIQGGQVSTSWIVLVVFVVLGVAVTGVLQIFQLRITENLQQKIFTRAAFEFAYRIPRIRMEALYKHYAPELMNRFFDTMSVQKGLSKILIDFSAASLQIIFGLILLSFYHPFFIIFSFVLVFLVLIIFRLTAKPGLKTSLEESKHKYRMAHWLEEMARTSNTFKLAGSTDLPLKRTDELSSDYLKARESHFQILIKQFSLMVVFKVVVAFGLLFIGGLLVMEQLMNIGQFVAAEIIVLLIINSVEKLIWSLEMIYDVLTSLEKIGQVTDLELENTKGIDIRKQCESEGMLVELKDASFAYPGHDKKVLHNINLTFNPGEKVVITGPNGAGKSTLLQVVAGLYDVPDGSLNYAELPKGNVDMSSLRSTIGDFLSQELLFEGSVFDNISMGRPEATFDNVKWAVENCGLTRVIQNLPGGYDCNLDPQGKRLPRSIVNRLLLARSIADRPKLLLLEDAFEHLNGQEREPIIDFITSDENPWTLVAVSADPYLISRAEKVVEMEDGRVKNITTRN